MKAERWLPIPGYEGDYDVSDRGRVRSWVIYRWKPGPRILAGRESAFGYRVVCLSKAGVHRTWFVHLLVLSAFVGPKPTRQETRHLDGDRTNNVLANLRYGTRTENAEDRVRHGHDWQVNKTHCPHGHLYDETNTIVRRGRRHCRACANEASRLRRATNPEWRERANADRRERYQRSLAEAS